MQRGHLQNANARTSGLLSSAVSRATTCRATTSRAIAAWTVDTRAIAAWTIDTRAIAAWTVDTRAVAAWPINSGPVNRSMPTVPSDRAAPTKASAPVIATPVPAGAAPTVIVPTIAPTLPDELRGLDDGQFIRRSTQARRGADHGGLSGSADVRSGKGHGYDEEHDLLSHNILPLRRESGAVSRCRSRGLWPRDHKAHNGFLFRA
jgi:hypothetical protein